MTPGMLIVSLIFVGISMLVSYRLQGKFREYSGIPTSSGLTGKQIAQKMLNDNGIYDVQVISVDGFLTDHYDPTNKTVNLSPEVYSGANVAAAAVAAHECGHAIQHKNAYAWLGLRSRLVPMVQFSSQWLQFVLMIGVFALYWTSAPLLIGIILFGLTTLFALVTLPVEFDASRRALIWLDNTNVMRRQEHDKAKDALWWAAMTYVVSAVASVVMLVQYIFLFLGARDRN
ncbi:zinc metallopeptidase [Chitinophaga sp. LS1]|uniref:zinc metallopeptidase n=1 Tax=Chitinophaga sp. LS1 TaxID=3051176 RepID=UPI002AABB8CF|nr:zinc metallopeptidase [Chitinophaga sp. LS1]WPV68802.1 zinc metallopeptidase [Chitinophaga sp. LS1]